MMVRMLLIGWLVTSKAFGIDNAGKTSLILQDTKPSKSSWLERHSEHGSLDRFRFEDQQAPTVERPIKFEDDSKSDRIKFKNDQYLETVGNLPIDVNNNGIVKKAPVKKIKFEEISSNDLNSGYDDEGNELKRGLKNDFEIKTKLVTFERGNGYAVDILNEFVTERVAFQDNGVRINDKDPQKKRKTKRRRKQPSGTGTGGRYPERFSGYGLYPGIGYPSSIRDPGVTYPHYVGANYYGYPNYQSYPAEYPSHLYPNGNFGLPNFGNPVPQSYHGYYKPTRRPKSLASQAVSAVVDALTSIAMYDDSQCVPRLLCEAAGGRVTGSSTLLSAASGLQPLLTMLSGYNGVSSSPLFVFGRAVILGATSNGNAATCRYAYPQCPTDPEQLIYYLNNHNGGFFRFFNSPPQETQNLEQFYNHLAGQYGLYQPNTGQQGYGFQNQIGYGLQNQNLYGNSQQYGPNYGYNKKNGLYDNQSVKDNYGLYNDGIKDRIQNTPINALDDIEADEDLNSKWLFPDEANLGSTNNREKELGISGSNTLKFPDEDVASFDNTDLVRTGKNIIFPGKYVNYLQNLYTYGSTTEVSLKDYEFDHKHNFYVKKEESNDKYNKVAHTKRPYNYYMNEGDGFRTVYIVRGNGDPNHPEILKIKAGQSL